jgi:RimJ/RimL family protein N-acetyltransferase
VRKLPAPAAYHPAIAEIVTERLVLRPLRAGDLPAFVAYRRDPGVARYQDWDAGYSMAEAERFLAEQRGLELGRPGAWVQLAAVERGEGALVGDCAARVMTEPPATAEVGVTLAPAGQGRGLAREAVEALVTALFDDHDMHRVIAHTDDRNGAAHRLFEALGFRCEARLVEADRFKGEWATLRIYAVLEREWRSRRRG